MLSLDDARALLVSRVTPLPAVEVPLALGLGCRLAAAPEADADLPPSDLAAMDGYAARAEDLVAGRPVPIAFVVPAGAASEPLHASAAVRIFTGAVVPPGADTVVPQEEAEVLTDGRVRLPRLPPGSHMRRRGEIFAAGAVLAQVSESLSPALLAVLAAGGVVTVKVIPRPRVAVLVTGAEFVHGSTVPAPGQVRDSNGPLLAALADQSRLEVSAPETVGDELPALCGRLEAAAGKSDIVVTSGGVSVGDFDLVPRAVEELGGEIVLHRVAIQPGKPILIARLGETWLAGLPGNPVSALVGWRLFALPLAETLAGDAAAFGETPVPAVLTSPARNSSDRTQLRPALLELRGGEWRVTMLPWKGSHDVLAAASANALARLEGSSEIESGTSLPCFPLPWRWTG